MEDWKEYKATDFCKNVTDGTHDSPKQKSEGYYLITSKHIKGNTIDFDSAYKISEEDYNKIIQRSKVDQWDVIISMIGAYCGFCYLEKSTKTDYAIKNVGLFKVGSEIKSKWLYYYLSSPAGQNKLHLLRTGSSQPYIALNSLRNFTIPVPDEKTMRSIIYVLQSLDDKIEVNRRINENLEQQAQALFKSWLEGCQDEVSIGDLSLNITDYSKCNHDQVVLINSSDVTEGFFDHHILSPNKDLKGHFKKRFKKGDILYSQVRPRNRHWGYCTFDADNYLASTQLMVIRNKEELIPSILLYQYIIDDKVWMDFTLKTETRSGTFPQGNYEDLSSIRVPYSSDVDSISKELNSLYSMIYNNEQESRRLTELRDTLLPRLMSGELKVNDLENNEI